MSKRINVKLLFAIVASLADEAIILAIILLVLWQLGIAMPIWFIVTLSLIFSAITFIVYRALRKNPQLGFENMIGQSGSVVEPIARKGTVRIDGELWFAMANGEKIEAGDEIIVVEQTGLKLTVIRKTNENQSPDIVAASSKAPILVIMTLRAYP
jgi:membrane-bound ClpP family serine protease